MRKSFVPIGLLWVFFPLSPALKAQISVDISGCQTVYHGYSNDYGCTNLNVRANQGQDPYRYRWNTGERGANIRVCPQGTTMYYVTITDATGQEMMAVAVVEVVQVRCEQLPERILLCLPADIQKGGDNALCLSPPMAAQRLAEGYRLGRCDQTPCNGRSSTTPTTDDRWIFETLAEVSPGLRLYPNPAREVVFIEMTNFSPGPFSVSLLNNLGNTLLRRNIDLREDHTYYLPVDDLLAGAYWIRVEGNGMTDTRKLIVSGR